VDACVKAGLLDLVGHAIERGWPVRRATAALGLDHARYHHWALRRHAGRLANAPPGGHPVHGLLAWERAAIVELFEAWGQIDRTHRKLAHRGSRIGLVHVSESTVARVLAAEGLVLEGPPPRDPVPPHAVAGLAGMEAQPGLGLRLHPLDTGKARLDRDPGRGLPQVAGHPNQRGGDLHPGRGLLPRRPGRRGPAHPGR